MLTLHKHRTIDRRAAYLPVVFFAGYLVSFALLSRIAPIEIADTDSGVTVSDAPRTGSASAPVPMPMPFEMTASNSQQAPGTMSMAAVPMLTAQSVPQTSSTPQTQTPVTGGLGGGSGSTEPIIDTPVTGGTDTSGGIDTGGATGTGGTGTGSSTSGGTGVTIDTGTGTGVTIGTGGSGGTGTGGGSSGSDPIIDVNLPVGGVTIGL